MGVLLITNALLEPYDEGFRKFAYNLCEYCHQQNYPVFDQKRSSFKDYFKLLFRKRYLIIYLPLSSITFNSLLRAVCFKMFFHATRVVVIGLQPREYRSWQKKMFRYFPLGIAVQSPDSVARLQALGFSWVMRIQSGVDRGRFRAVEDPEQIRRLRQKYGIPPAQKIILHVGHLKNDRNLMTLTGVQRSLPGIQTVIVASTSTQPEREVAEELEKAGVMIIRDYVPRIEEIYQLADLYFFPVVSRYDSIEIPLSLIEALSCGIPALVFQQRLTSDLPGLFYCAQGENLPAKVGEVFALNLSKSKIAAGVERYHWDQVFEEFFNELSQRDQTRI
ncbi:MAG TPA: glycosyltransferase [Bacillota bacterium]|nr:glycosyltransferase [Bacillota bacterium]